MCATSPAPRYANRIISAFSEGLLDLPAAASLKTHLAERLECEEARLSEKFTGEASVDAREFQPAATSAKLEAHRVAVADELAVYAQRWKAAEAAAPAAQRDGPDARAAGGTANDVGTVSSGGPFG